MASVDDRILPEFAGRTGKVLQIHIQTCAHRNNSSSNDTSIIYSTLS